MLRAMKRARLIEWLPVAVVATAAMLLAALGPAATALLRFERESIAHGELWRLLTGHFVHLGWTHLLLNLLGLGLVWSLVGRGLTSRRWYGALVLCALGVSAGLWFLDPGVAWYVGLSGVLHGLLVCGSLGLLAENPGAALLYLLAVGVKLLVEQPGISGLLEIDIGGPTIASAHSYGALTGLLLGIGYQRKALARWPLRRVR